jgi:hypothetical protein
MAMMFDIFQGHLGTEEAQDTYDGARGGVCHREREMM